MGSVVTGLCHRQEMAGRYELSTLVSGRVDSRVGAGPSHRLNALLIGEARLSHQCCHIYCQFHDMVRVQTVFSQVLDQ